VHRKRASSRIKPAFQDRTENGCNEVPCTRRYPQTRQSTFGGENVPIRLSQKSACRQLLALQDQAMNTLLANWTEELAAFGFEGSAATPAAETLHYSRQRL
jgi:hypothetical protein